MQASQTAQVLIYYKSATFFIFAAKSQDKIFFWLRAVYCAESVFSTLKYEYLGENKTEFENILTHWSEAKAGLNDEKN